MMSLVDVVGCLDLGSGVCDEPAAVEGLAHPCLLGIMSHGDREPGLPRPSCGGWLPAGAGAHGCETCRRTPAGVDGHPLPATGTYRQGVHHRLPAAGPSGSDSSVHGWRFAIAPG